MSAHRQQIQAIQSMLVAGHRSVHLDRHTLLLIGGVGGFLSVATEWVITDTRFPDVSQRGMALLVWLGGWLGTMALLDAWLTRQARSRRDETLPFAQAQITRAWWMLLSLGCLGSFAMFFYGGGAMIYALWTVLLGLGIYFFGLFSRPLIEWIGLATILLGVAGLAAGLPYGGTRWLNASCFAIGMPLAGWLNGRLGETRLPRRGLALSLWLALVVGPPLLILRYAPTQVPTGPVLSTPALTGQGAEILRLEAGSRIPLRVDLDSSVLSVSPQAALELIFQEPVDVALIDGQPDGRYRIGTGDWHAIREGVLNLMIDRITPQLRDGLPEVRAHASFDLAQHKEQRP
ncbi:MAG: hypothetical protein AB1899_02950 [Pseudomonadota bacterium]